MPIPNSRRRNFLLVLFICLVLMTSAGGQQRDSEPHAFLRGLGFSQEQTARVDHGEIAVKVLKTHKHEAGAVAVVRMNVPQEFFIARVRDIERHKKSEAVLIARKFSEPATPEDLSELTLPAQDSRSLQTCQPGECSLKLSTEQMELIQRQVDFSAPDTEQQANAAIRRLLLDYARNYEENGNKAMIVYADKGHAVASASEFAELLDRSSRILAYAPEFRDYLRDFPNTALEGVERFLYWSKENYGHRLKPVISLTDLVIYHQPGKNPPFLIASKQIYASHYMEGSLALTMLFDRTEADPSPSFYLVYVNRSRFDPLRKWYSFLARGNVTGKARDSLVKNVTELRSKVEAEFKAAAAQAARPGVPAQTTRGK